MSVAIVGGGISGLSTAYFLTKAGISGTIIEKRPRLGGVIQTEQIDDCLVEGGPDSFLSAKPWALELIRELGLESEVIGSNDHLRKTFIRRHGRMVPIPDGLQLLVPTRVAPIVTTPLFGWGTKLRMAAEWLRKPPSEPRGDISVADFVREHYGQEAVEYLAEPLLAGVYGGVPEELSVASVLPRFVDLEARHGSLSRGILAERRAAAPQGPLFRTLKRGLGSLVAALAPANVIRGEVEALERSGSGFRLRVSGDWMDAAQVALCCEAHSAAKLAATLDGNLGAALAAIPYNSSTVVAMGFDPSSFLRPLEGFGFLVPRRERRRIVACTFMQTKFSFRAPQNKILIRCFLAGAGEDGDSGVTAAVLDELRGLAGLTGAPSFTRVYTWPRSMAQYTVGHKARVDEAEARLREIPGLHLAGNAYHGVGIPDCVRMGREIAARIAS